MDRRVLVVDDERPLALAMSQVLDRGGYAVDTAADGREALDRLARRSYGLVVTDLRMPGLDGRELVRRVRAMSPATRVVVVTAHGTVASAVACVREGAADYLMKPFEPAALLEAAAEAFPAVAAGSEASDPAMLVAEDPATRAALDLARRAAASDVTVLLEAESGAGKEIFARVIHRESPRREGPFVAVNCAALPRELLEAELFGHARGAFTGAHRDRKGRFQTADGGTLLLDEIGEMSIDLQARLLRVLQDRIVHPVGADEPLRVDVRLIAATHRDLRVRVAAGAFREDLYYRLRVLPLRIPPLRERPGDIEPLARRFAERFGAAGLDAAVIPHLLEHAWPGNVRELENVIQRAAILAGEATIRAEHAILEPAPGDVLAACESADSDRPVQGLPLEQAERQAIRRTLERTRGNRNAAAAALGISPRTLRHKLKRWRDEGRPLEAELA